MSVWHQYLTMTEKLDEVVHQPVTEKNRSAIIEQVEEYLNERELLLEKLEQPSDEEKELLDDVKRLDLKINQKLEFLFDGLKRDMRNMKKQKSSKQRYVNPYQSVSGFDGMYLDHKK